MQAGARRLADRVEAGHGRRAVEVGDDAAHHVVRRRARPARARVAGSRPASRSAPTTLGNCSGSICAHVEPHVRPPGLASSCGQIARATSSRGASSSTKRSPSVVEQRRALAADRLGDEEALAALDAGDRGRVELDRARGRRARRRRSRASSRPIPSEPGGLVVRDHSAAAPPVARIVRARRGSRGRPRRRRRRSARRAVHSVAARGASSTVDARVLGDDGADSWRTIAPAGRAAAGVDDAPRASGRPRGRARGGRGGRRRSARRGARGRRRVRAPRGRGPSRRCGARAPRPARSACPRGAVGRVVGGERGGERRPAPSSDAVAASGVAETSATWAPSLRRGERA